MLKRRISPAGLIILSGVIAAFHLGKVSPAIASLQEGLGLTLMQAGFLLSLMQLAGMVAAVTMGVFCDSIGPRRSIIIGQTLLCLASLAGAAAQHPYHLLLLRAFESLGLLMVVLPTPGLLRQWVPHERLAVHLCLWGCYVALGTSMAFICGPILIELIGWRGWWSVPAVASLLMIAVLLQRLPRDQAPLSKTPTAKTPGHDPATPFTQRLMRLFKRRDPWLVGIAFAMYSGQWLAVIGFLPATFAAADIPPAMVGPLTASAALVNICGNIAAAVLLHRGINAKRLLTVGYVGMATMAFVAFIPLTDTMPLLQYSAIMAFSAIGGLIPGSLYMLALNATPNDESPSASLGRVQQLSSTGMFLLPPLLARVAQWSGNWHWTWVITAVASLIGLLLSTRLTARRSTKECA